MELAVEGMWEGRENRIAACDVSKSNISKLLHCSLVNIDGFDPDFLVVVADSPTGVVEGQVGSGCSAGLEQWLLLHSGVALGCPNISPAFPHREKE